MKYTIRWHGLAEEELANVWLAAPDRELITAASSEVEALLERDPVTVGESRDGNTRILYVPTLAVRYSVIEDDRLVFVAAVWTLRKRKGS